ncbi:MAG: TIGR04282 family arsenosugar biosynthesis glycosyltransferase [Aridibacter sp.]
MKKAIIIMTKVPEAGKVKTRLQPFLTEKQSVELAVAFLQDAESKAHSVTENLIVAVSPFEERNRLTEILQHKPLLIEQTGETLGDKMFNAFKFAFEKGLDSVVMIGTDSPTFPADYIEQAFEFLELETDVVLGKTEDGGFYLIGLKILDTRIFENVSWSSAETFEQIWQNIMNLKLHLREVPGWYDVDEKEDFERLQTELNHSKNAQRRAAKNFELLAKF